MRFIARTVEPFLARSLRGGSAAYARHIARHSYYVGGLPNETYYFMSFRLFRGVR